MKEAIPFHPSCPVNSSSSKHCHEPPGSELGAASSELAPGRACAPSSWGLTRPNKCVTCHLLHFGVCLQDLSLNKGSSSSAPRARCSSVIYSAGAWQSNISSLEPSPASAPYRNAPQDAPPRPHVLQPHTHGHQYQSWLRLLNFAALSSQDLAPSGELRV